MRLKPIALALLISSPGWAQAQTHDAVMDVCLADDVDPALCACAQEFIQWLLPTNPGFVPYEVYEAMLAAGRDAVAGGDDPEAAEAAVIAAYWSDLSAADLRGVVQNQRDLHRGAITGCDGPDVPLRW